MRRTRFITLFFLALSIAFFAVTDFRWALRLGWLVTSEDYSRMLRGGMSTGRLEDVAEEANTRRDARRLAFVALRLPEERIEDAFRLAQQAVSYDRQYTWVLFDLVANSYYRRDLAPPVVDLLPKANEQVRAWDPDNGAPFLEQAAMIRLADPGWPPAPVVASQHAEFVQNLASRTEWREAMSHVFAASRYDDYSVRRFELDRDVLAQLGLLRPDTMLRTVLTRPSWNSVTDAVMFRVEYEGPRLQAAGRTDEALKLYREGVLFGARLALNGSSRWEQFHANRAEKQFGEALFVALQKGGRADEARLLDVQLASVRNRENLWKQDLLSGSSAPSWFGLLMGVSYFGVLLFGTGTVIVFSALVVLRKAEVSPANRVFQLLSTAGNYLPALLFFACLSLYIVYTPYATNFHHYMSADMTQVHRVDGFLENAIPYAWLIWGPRSLPVENPLVPYGYWALGILGISGGLKWLGERHQKRAARLPESRGSGAARSEA